jgi:hypothetical protein
MNETPSPEVNAGQLQEAIDMIAQTFEYPDKLTIQHTVTDGAKRTRFEVETDEIVRIFELTYDGHDDTAEPEFTRIE